MDAESEVDKTESEQVPLARVFGARQRSALPTPMVQEVELPLRAVAPEVFERVVVEFVWLIEGLRGVHLYGRRGQRQYGLDVAGTDARGDTVVYQAKRFQTITLQRIRKAIERYAGRPGVQPEGLPSRRFDAGRFVLVTSAQIEGDTAFTDELTALQRVYREHGLVVEVFGAEQISRTMEDNRALGELAHQREYVQRFGLKRCELEVAQPGHNSYPGVMLVELVKLVQSQQVGLLR